MTEGLEELDLLIEKVKKLGTLPEDLAKTLAPKVADVVKASAKAGETPDGQAWAPRKADGSRALVNAADAVTARAAGSTIVLALQGTKSGDAKVQAIQNAQRNIIPAKGEAIPGRIVDVLQAGAREAFEKAVRG